MEFLAAIQVLDTSMIGALLIATGIVTMWLGRSSGAGARAVAGAGGASGVDLHGAGDMSGTRIGARALARLSRITADFAGGVGGWLPRLAVLRLPILRLPAFGTSLPSASAAARATVPAAVSTVVSTRLAVPARSKQKSAASAPAIPVPQPLTLGRQLEMLSSRVVSSLETARSSQTKHVSAERQLDAAEYQLGQLKSELAVVLAGGSPGAKPGTRPQALPRRRPGVVLRPASLLEPRRLAA